jgi:hypothetical protein
MTPPEKSFFDGLGDLATPTNPTEFWTLVTAVGSLILLFVALRGLRSLKLTRDELKLTRTDMLNRAKRDALQSAMDRAQEWASRIIPENAAILEQIFQHKVPVFIASPAQVRFNPDNAEEVARAKQWCAALPEGMYGNSLRLLNHVEAWAMYFTTGLADHEVAFGPCAPTLCQMVMQDYAILLVTRADPASGKYPNTVTLFTQWLHLLAQQERGQATSQLLDKVRELQSKGPANPNLLPKPLGLDIDGTLK